MAFLHGGVDGHDRELNQKTPLYEACINGYLGVAMTLVDRGAVMFMQEM